MQNRNDRSARAQIFLPFDSLKGFREYIKEKERVVVKRKQLSQDDCDILNRKLFDLKVGQMVQIVYYDNDEYVQLEGLLSAIDLEYTKTVTIVNEKIRIYDIVEISF